MTLDGLLPELEVVRKDFPILERELAGGFPLVYLDSANTSQKPQVVIDAMVDHLEHHNANVARAMHQLGAESSAAFEEGRDDDPPPRRHHLPRADDGFRLVIAPLHDDVREERLDESQRGVVLEEDDGVHRRQPAQDDGAVLLRVHRPRGALEPPHRGVGVEADDEVIPEGARVFARQPVEQNLRLGAYILRDEALYRQRLQRVYKLFPRLLERREQLAGTMSGGERQMLAIGRALMSGPRLLLIDEPSLGLSPILIEQVFDALVALNRQDGLAVLLVEQNMAQALEVATRAYVMQSGRIALEGTAADLAASDEVRKAYLGM